MLRVIIMAANSAAAASPALRGPQIALGGPPGRGLGLRPSVSPADLYEKGADKLSINELLAASLIPSHQHKKFSDLAECSFCGWQYKGGHRERLDFSGDEMEDLQEECY